MQLTPRPGPPRAGIIVDPDGVRRTRQIERRKRALCATLSLQEKAPQEPTGTRVAWVLSLWSRDTSGDTQTISCHGLTTVSGLWDDITARLTDLAGHALPTEQSFQIGVADWHSGSRELRLALSAPPKTFRTVALKGEQEDPGSEVLREAQEILQAHYGHLTNLGDENKPSSLTYYTDGSFLRGQKIGGAAVVSDIGEWAAKSLADAQCPYECEIVAAHLALERAPKTLPLLIVTDALNLVRDMHPTTPPARGTHTPRAASALEKLRHALSCRSAPVTFEWTPGHSGPGPNDAADRLARLYARHFSDRIHRRVTRAVALRILSENGFDTPQGLPRVGVRAA